MAHNIFTFVKVVANEYGYSPHFLTLTKENTTFFKTHPIIRENVANGHLNVTNSVFCKYFKNGMLQRLYKLSRIFKKSFK